MPQKIAKPRIIVKDTKIRRLRIKGLAPNRIVVLNNLTLKDVTFYTVDSKTHNFALKMYQTSDAVKS
jgi:hypothetical protein